jgi:hypothetical protein
MEDALPNTGRMSQSSVEVLILLGAVVLVSLIAFIWITFFRKGGRRRPARQTAQRTFREQLEQHGPGIKPPGKKGKDKGQGQNIQYRANPTLAQTGGLPPLRPPKNPPDPPPPS